MSLINDALKRAKQSQQNVPPTGVGPLPPVEPPRGGGSGWMLGLAAILFLAAAGLFIGTALFRRPAPPVAAAKTPEVFAPPAKPATPAPVPVPASTPAPVSKPVRVSSPATSASPVIPAAKAPPPAPVEQLPKVQGIIFSARPVAIVNGKTVGVGDDVGNFRVKQILKDSIVFQRPDGSQKTLNIGE